MRTKSITSAVVVAGLLAATTVFAQRGQGWWGNYDSKTVETITGKVTAVEKVESPHHGPGMGPGMHRGMGVHLTLQTDKETISVSLGPDWFVDKQSPKIEKGDTVTVTGSRVTMDGKPALIAATVTKGDKVIKLRDENGAPLWAGRGRRGQ